MIRLATYFLALCLLVLLTGGVVRAQWTPLAEPFGTDVVSLAEYNGTLLATSPMGIYRSVDGGLHWTETMTTRNIRKFARVGTTIVAGTAAGILISNDDGQSWTPQFVSALNGIVDIVSDGTTLYASTYSGSGVIISTDKGITWETSSEGLPTGYVQSFAVVGTDVYLCMNQGIFAQKSDGSWRQLERDGVYQLFSVGEILFAGNFEKWYRSTDKGNTWDSLAYPPASLHGIVARGTELFAGSSTGILRSTDNGTTWEQVGLESMNIYCLAVRGTTVFAGTYRYGLYASNNGTTWEPYHDGLRSTLYVDALGANGDYLIAATGSDIGFYKGSTGATWTGLPALATSASVVSLITTNSTLVVGTNMQGVFSCDLDSHAPAWKKLDGVMSGKTAGSLLRHGSSIIAAVTESEFPPVDSIGIYRSDDMGTTWIPSDLKARVSCLTYHNGALYASVNPDMIWMSIDGGAHWTKVSGALPELSLVRAFTSNGSTLFISTSNGKVFASHDNASSWQEAAGGLFGIRSIYTLAASGSAVFAGTEIGVFKTEDNGALWESVSTGLGDSYVLTLAAYNNNLYAGTSGSGVWQRPLAELVTTSVQERTIGNAQYSLAPHPLTSTSRLQLDNTCGLHNATLTLSTVAGRLVRTSAGLYGTSVSVERGSLAAGMYVFTLEEAGRVVASGTLVVE